MIGEFQHGGLVTLGETMALVTPTEVGPLQHTRLTRLGIAGSESNVAIGVRRLDQPAAWIGRVGKDELGDLILRELRAERLSVHASQDPAPTGLMVKARRTAEVVRVLYYRDGSAGSRLSQEDVDEDVVRAAGIVHITGITPALGTGPAAAVSATIEAARAARIPVSFDINYRSALWDASDAAVILRDLAKRADLLFASEAEAALLVGADEPERMLAALTTLGPSQIVVKRGSAGATAHVDGHTLTCPAVPVVAVDPVGAGDAFVAGYLASFLAGADAEERLATAACAGAFAVTVPGDWEGLPRREELALLQAPEPVLR